MTQDEIDKMTTLEEFIAFYEAIPVGRWVSGYFEHPFTKQCCAIGHIGGREINGQRAIVTAELSLVSLAPGIIDCNDGGSEWLQFGITPKERVVNYLKSLLPPRDLLPQLVIEDANANAVIGEDAPAFIGAEADGHGIVVGA